jgi:hypothetical protein
MRVAEGRATSPGPDRRRRPCHPPLSGHGINLGYQDARVLAGLLADLDPWRDPGELPVLRAYARARLKRPRSSSTPPMG